MAKGDIRVWGRMPAVLPAERLVSRGAACPNCGERRSSKLDGLDNDSIHCETCGITFDAPGLC
jgi:transcription elongation factor Elf1